MTSRERLLAVLNGHAPDHVPLTTWSFGFRAPPGLGWQTDGRDIPHWYSLRLEHLHTLPYPWTVEDEFRRALAWRRLGVDDALEVSMPWSQAPEVEVRDRVIESGAADGDPRHAVMEREYRTPAGVLRHAVRRTDPEPPGWPSQPACVPLIEDYSIPRAVRHLVARPEDVPALRYLFAPPDEAQQRWWHERLATMWPFAEREGFLVQAWTAFGMDAVVWFMGTEGAVLMAMDAPEAFGRLVETIAETDHARTELAARAPGIDVVCQRGWYSSTDFWSPDLFDQFVFPHVARLAAKRANPALFTVVADHEVLPGKTCAAIGNCFLLQHPLKHQVQISRRISREALAAREEELLYAAEHGAVLVSPSGRGSHGCSPAMVGRPRRRAARCRNAEHRLVGRAGSAPDPVPARQPQTDALAAGVRFRGELGEDHGEIGGSQYEPTLGIVQVAETDGRTHGMRCGPSTGPPRTRDQLTAQARQAEHVVGAVLAALGPGEARVAGGQRRRRPDSGR